MDIDKVKRIDEIPFVLDVSEQTVGIALKTLREENYTDSVILDAINRNLSFIRHMKGKQPIVGLLIETVRRQVRMDRDDYGWDKPSGNPVRDRLLEVGKYDPFSPDYVGDIIKNHTPIFKKRYWTNTGARV